MPILIYAAFKANCTGVKNYLLMNNEEFKKIHDNVVDSFSSFDKIEKLRSLKTITVEIFNENVEVF